MLLIRKIIYTIPYSYHFFLQILPALSLRDTCNVDLDLRMTLTRWLNYLPPIPACVEISVVSSFFIFLFHAVFVLRLWAMYAECLNKCMFCSVLFIPHGQSCRFDHLCLVWWARLSFCVCVVFLYVYIEDGALVNGTF